MSSEAQNHTATFRHFEYSETASVYLSGTTRELMEILASVKLPVDKLSLQGEHIEVSLDSIAVSIEMADDHTCRISSSNKKFIWQIVRQIRRKKNIRKINTHRPKTSVYSTGDFIVIGFFCFLTLFLASLFFRAIDDMSLDLTTDARMLEGRVTKVAASHGRNLRSRSTRFLDFTVEGNHTFRFAPKENYDLLWKEMKAGERIRIYHATYGDKIYQIEKDSRILYDKSNFENGQIILLVMSSIFSVLSLLATLFCIKRPLRKKKFRTS